MMRTLRTMAIKSMCSIIYHLTQTALAVNDSEDNDSEFELINQSKASSTTVEPFKLMKVDSGDYSIMLKASFEIYRYTKLENGTYDWLPAVDFKENAAKDRNSVIWEVRRRIRRRHSM